MTSTGLKILGWAYVDKTSHKDTTWGWVKSTSGLPYHFPTVVHVWKTHVFNSLIASHSLDKACGPLRLQLCLPRLVHRRATICFLMVPPHPLPQPLASTGCFGCWEPRATYCSGLGRVFLMLQRLAPKSTQANLVACTACTQPISHPLHLAAALSAPGPWAYWRIKNGTANRSQDPLNTPPLEGKMKLKLPQN